MCNVLMSGCWKVYLVPDDGSKVWISAPQGEGGEFCRVAYEAAIAGKQAADELRQAIDKFFWDNFKREMM